MQDYTFRLHEHPKFKWSPSLSAKDFMAVLANITAIKIRGTYVPNGAGFLDEVKLESARRGIATGQATWIERCPIICFIVTVYFQSICAPNSTICQVCIY